MNGSAIEPGMTQDTLQFVYKALVIAFVVAFAGVIGALIASIFHFGDGEAQRIIADLTPAVLGAFGTMGLMFLGHQGVSALQTMTAAGLAQQAAAAAAVPPATPATPATPAATPATGSGAQGHVGA